MDLQNTLKKHVMQLKNNPRILQNVASVVRDINATLYDTYFPGALDNLDVHLVEIQDT